MCGSADVAVPCWTSVRESMICLTVVTGPISSGAVAGEAVGGVVVAVDDDGPVDRVLARSARAPAGCVPIAAIDRLSVSGGFTQPAPMSQRTSSGAPPAKR